MFAARQGDVLIIGVSKKALAKSAKPIARDKGRVVLAYGVQVPQYVIARPGEISVEKIDQERNAEVRRVMIERYAMGGNSEIVGTGAYIRDAGGKRLDHDEAFGTLWRREMPDDEPIVMIEVVNSTAEPDGHFKRYFLRVPPTMRKAREAVAWTFNMTADEYAPMVET
jgi:hypothetical protein